MNKTSPMILDLIAMIRNKILPEKVSIGRRVNSSRIKNHSNLSSRYINETLLKIIPIEMMIIINFRRSSILIVFCILA
jgi:hypothetical protein